MSLVELRNGDRKILGTGGLLAVIAGIAGWFILQFWLVEKLNWPDAYGHPCHLSRNCWVQDMWNSPALLYHGGFWSDLLFAVVWAPWAFIFSGPLVQRLRKNRRSRDLISPPNISKSE